MRVARRTLNWIRVMRWSEERGKMIRGCCGWNALGVVVRYGINGVLGSVLIREAGMREMACWSSIQQASCVSGVLVVVLDSVEA